MVYKQVGTTWLPLLSSGSHQTSISPTLQRPLKTSWSPCIVVGTKTSKAMPYRFLYWTFCQKHHKKVNKQDSLGFYSQLFLVPKLGNCWRPVIAKPLSHNARIQDESPESIQCSQKKRMGHLNRPYRCIPTPFYSSPSQGNFSGFITMGSRKSSASFLSG